MTLKDFVLKNVPPNKYYAARFPQWSEKFRPNVRCPFHPDKAPSLNVALHNGGARCHASTCGKSIGNIVHFEAELTKEPEKIVARKLYVEFVRPIVSSKVVAQYRDNLTCNGNLLLQIRKEMGLSAVSLRRFCIGWDIASSRVVIPIYNQWDQCINLRFYKLPSQRRASDTCKIYNLKGYGAIELFPWPAIAEYPINEPLYIMASEKEAMLAIQNGLNAIVSTAGEGSWCEEWNTVCANRNVFLVFDKDKGGVAAFTAIQNQIASVAKSVNRVDFQFKTARPDRKDFADWVLKEHNSPLQLKAEHENSLHAKRNGSKSNGMVHHRDASYPGSPALANTELYDVSEISRNSKLLNTKIQVQGIVAARASSSYSIPWKFRIKPKGKASFIHEIGISRYLMRFIGANDAVILQSLQNQLGLRENEFGVEIIDYVVATRVEIIPIAAVDRDVPYVVQSCYYFGSNVKDNVPYLFDVIPTSDIRNQETLGIITNCIPISLSIERFTMTGTVRKRLEAVFVPEGGSWDQLKQIANELAQNHTHILNRLDWHLVALLCWTSPLGWKFPTDTDVSRGWLNCLGLGDTETGKSKVAKTFQKLFNCGNFVNSENCTLVGLVGGAIKMGNGQLMLRWGRIPLSDKQLVVLEELSGLGIEEISHMSDVRSSGVACIDKGGINSQTNARTRLLCLSNARGRNRQLSQYLFGVKAIQELIGHGEDIARFDLITTLVDSEVDIELINSENPQSEVATIAKGPSKEDWRTLIHFIWSLKPEQIQFTNAAYHECLSQTKELASIYHPSIPVFKGGSGRYKLGRIAASIACLQFSYDRKYKRIQVLRSHVRAARSLLSYIYDKPSFGYKEYSRHMAQRDTIQQGDALAKMLKERISVTIRSQAIEALIHSSQFTVDEICSFTDNPLMYAHRILGTMLRSGVIRKGDGPVWHITPPGKRWLEQFIKKT